MNEKDILLLEGLGYIVNDYGGIIDKEGNYLDSVVYKGKAIKSYQTRGEYEDMQKVESLNAAIESSQKNEEIVNGESKTITSANESTVQTNDNFSHLVLPISIALLIGIIAFISLKYFRKHKGFTYYLIVLVISFIFSVYLGFKNKILNNQYFLNKASQKKSEWQKESYLDYVRSQDSFFKLNNYSFNWEWCVFTLLILLLVAIVIRNTIYFDKLKSFVKSIRR